MALTNLALTQQISFALEVNCLFCLLAIKTSLLFLYRAVLTLNNPRLKFAWYAVGASVLAFTVGSILATSLQCKPIHYQWYRFYDHIQGHCVDPVHRELLLLIPSVLNTLADVALLILPIPTLWNLQIPLRPKLGLIVVLLLGTL